MVGKEESRAAYLWSAVLLALAIGLVLIRQWVSVLAVFPLYFAAQIAWTQYWMSRGAPSRAGHSR